MSPRFDSQGLVPVVIQHAISGEVLTLAWANADALERTRTSGETWLWSRSRQELWNKGATSGNRQQVLRVTLDCDGDAIVYQVIPAGPACHTGERSCFDSPPTLRALQDRLAHRRAQPRPGSWTNRLLDDENLRLKKLGEEAIELAMACMRGSDEEVASEAADLIYHAAVAMLARGLQLDDAIAVLQQRLEGPLDAQVTDRHT
jgi:phosphoribosyl-ATP pyrophosphohydrolase/phosphoribosyl-AMP cyclohydrolase